MQNLKVGSKGNNVATLQKFLQSLGLYTGAIDSDYGPKTQQAVKQFQQSQNIKNDGIVGPITEGKIQAYTIANHPGVQAAMASDPNYAAAMQKILNDPALSKAAGAAYNMLGSGTFTPEEYAKQYGDQYAALDTYYKENQKYGQTTAENNLGLNKRNLDRSLASDAGQFSSDKDALDQNAADKGILFSTSRMQNETGLQNKYKANADQKLDTYNTGVNNTLNDYEYKYGTPAAGALSAYMTTPTTPTYNASVAGGNVQSGALRSAYSPKNYYGTNNTAEQTYAGGNTNDYFKNLLNKANTEGYKTKI